MGEDTLEFENAKKAFAEEREKFNAEKKGLEWRVADAEEKLVREKQLNVDKQKDWEVACERTNKELQTQRDAIVSFSGEKRKISDEAEQERAAHQKREQEYIQRIAKLEKFAEENVAESKASEILVEEVTADCKWLLARAVPLEFESLELSIVKAAGKLSRKPNGIALLKRALGDEDPEGGDAEPSSQD
ncbi:hypothetical protein HanRHA438_Chr04g0170091 [Helianthus annuus]|uniref:Uncharacterized protein n=1 Tax=Helianthus annuus TaxID=4232 RepID=A0A9K3J6C0_HELAN|nr:hypothetical protein HanXRQr2_Chr04g0159921 [Helianthus annuus]KAJ0580641.1 hypothetical protein HanHA300_Chr04g0131591 [Helianthus annuus]KAJ0588277.1 hypothetical protein HanIR_Chr04g0172701 [Helianthus annuus]KAJ0596594.1 hypothetical protein HanHA89_Chr04g0144591 [Helianthus annuus]KAJ0757257.1 hypothetical protein HanLR1_Chr04g0136551 [Helianthus annuus]